MAKTDMRWRTAAASISARVLVAWEQNWPLWLWWEKGMVVVVVVGCVWRELTEGRNPRGVEG